MEWAAASRKHRRRTGGLRTVCTSGVEVDDGGDDVWWIADGVSPLSFPSFFPLSFPAFSGCFGVVSGLFCFLLGIYHSVYVRVEAVGYEEFCTRRHRPPRRKGQAQSHLSIPPIPGVLSAASTLAIISYSSYRGACARPSCEVQASHRDLPFSSARVKSVRESLNLRGKSKSRFSGPRRRPGSMEMGGPVRAITRNHSADKRRRILDPEEKMHTSDCEEHSSRYGAEGWGVGPGLGSHCPKP
jgi:hypothetical protein